MTSLSVAIPSCQAPSAQLKDRALSGEGPDLLQIARLRQKESLGVRVA